MHSRKLAWVLSRFARPSLIALALLGTARGDDESLFQPMSGACFLHDSGMEYIPSRLLGVQDVAATSDRGDKHREDKSWTCTDPSIDCAEQAEKFSRHEAFVQNLNEFHNTVQTTRTWTTQNWMGVSSQAIKQWNAGAAMLGNAAVHWAANEQADQADCPWDRTSNTETVSDAHPTSISATPVFKNGNIFVFTFGDVTAISPKLNDARFASDAESPSVTYLPTRSGEWLEKTAFARDYCIFAPYPLAEDAFPITASLNGKVDQSKEWSTQDAANEDAVVTRQQAALRLKQSVSLALAKGMTWLGNRLLESGANLADSVRIASESDESLTLEVK